MADTETVQHAYADALPLVSLGENHTFNRFSLRVTSLHHDQHSSWSIDERVKVIKQQKLITPAELVEMLGGVVSEKTLANWRYLGKNGPAYEKIGGAVFYDIEVVKEWRKSHRRQST